MDTSRLGRMKGSARIMNSKVEDFLNAVKLGEIMHTKQEEEKKVNKWLIIIAIVGVVLTVGIVAYTVYKVLTPDDFDEEILTTINKFFENNLNVSETSRQLYIHRNTLVYRLDKLQKSTGLDLRIFEDAITFRIALMVVKYMNYLETIEY